MDLGGLARRQCGVFTRSQARETGLSDRQIDRRLLSGRWRSIHRGVLAEAAVSDSPGLRMWAAHLAAGRDAVVSHTSAARMWGWAVPDLGIHLTVAPGRHPRVDDRVRIHRLPLGSGDVVLMRRLPVTDRVRTIADCASILPRHEVGDLLDRAVQRGWLTGVDIAGVIERHQRRPGNAAMRTLAAGLVAGAHFPAERLLHKLLRANGIIGWSPNHPVVSDGHVDVVDVAFPDYRLAIEVDGRAYHSGPERFQADRTRQNRLVGLGWTVLRFTWSDLTDRPAYVLTAIQAAIGAA